MNGVLQGANRLQGPDHPAVRFLPQPRPLRIGSLFSGIGGLELGLERAGLGRTVWQVEIDPWARQVLAGRWPEAARHDDVRTFDPEPGSADLVCGGFPCQDVSDAGQRRGIDGERSGLWTEYARVLRVVRPRFVVVENVAALLRRGFDRVLADLAALGYDAEWDCLPACAVGAPQERDRVFVLAYPKGFGRREGRAEPTDGEPLGAGGTRAAIPDAGGLGRGARKQLLSWRERNTRRGGPWGPGWETEPRLGGTPHGVPERLGRFRGYGNSVSPPVAEFIGGRIRMIEEATFANQGRPGQ